MNLASKSLLGFLVDPLGRHPRSLTLQEKGIAARGAASPWIGLEAIATRPSVTKGLLSTSLSLDLGGGRNLTLPEVSTAGKVRFRPPPRSKPDLASGGHLCGQKIRGGGCQRMG